MKWGSRNETLFYNITITGNQASTYDVTLMQEPIRPQMQRFLVLTENSFTWTAELLI